MYYVVIGSSRGLGAALVHELIKEESNRILGVSRTEYAQIDHYDQLSLTKRYQHVKLDITLPGALELMFSCFSRLPKEPVCVIFNAALQGTDIRNDGSINFDVFEEVNRIGIEGLYNVLGAAQNHLLTYGGMFVGISSLSALIPPVQDPRVAYPSTKAYLDMVLRCLRALWGKQVEFVTVHLGHMRDNKNSSQRGVPTYSKVAQKIVRSIAGSQVPSVIGYPFLYSFVYKYVFSFLPDNVYVWLLSFFLRIKR